MAFTLGMLRRQWLITLALLAAMALGSSSTVSCAWEGNWQNLRSLTLLSRSSSDTVFASSANDSSANCLQSRGDIILYWEGTVRLRRNAIESALDAFKAIRPTFRYPLVALRMGQAFESLGQHSKALGLWRSAHAEQFFEQQAIAASRSGDDADAEAHYRLALEVNDQDANILKELGALYERQQRWPEAYSRYARAAELAPKDWELAYHLGMALFNLGWFGDAQSEAERALRLNPSYPWSYILMGDTFRMAGQFDAAGPWYRKVSEMADEQDLGYEYLAINALGQGQSATALANLDRIHSNSIVPDADQHFWRSEAYTQLGQLDLALVHLEAAVAARPTVPVYQLTLAYLYQRLGRSSDARGAYERVLRLDPNNAQAKSGLAELGAH